MYELIDLETDELLYKCECIDRALEKKAEYEEMNMQVELVENFLNKGLTISDLNNILNK